MSYKSPLWSVFCLIVTLFSFVGLTPVAQAAPSNDNFASATSISGNTGSITGTNVGATRETGEPLSSWGYFTSSEQSVWYRWTAPATGGYTFATASNFENTVDVSTGSSVSALTSQAQVRTSGGPGFYVTIYATAGTTYNILVTDLRSSPNPQGSFTLSWKTGPVNDNFARPTIVSGAAGSVTGTNIGATREPGEVVSSWGYFTSSEQSVWYRWTAPASGSYTFATASDFENTIDVFTGSSPGALTGQTQLRNSGGPGFFATFRATAGVTYSILVTDMRSSPYPQGNFTLNWSPGPVNDDIARAINLTSRTVDVKGSNVGSTYETGEPLPDGSSNRSSIWYRWVAPVSGYAAFTTSGSNFTPLLSIFTGTTIANLVKPAQTTTGLGSNTTTVSFTAVAGTSYLILVDDYRGATGNLVLYGGAPCANDNFASAQLIGSGNGHVQGINFPASTQTGEPQHAGVAGGGSVWFKWTAPVMSGNVIFNTGGCDFNTLLAVYTGADVAHLTVVASNDDVTGNLIGASRLTFQPTAGATYYIAVDGKAGANGHYVLNWSSSALATSHLLWARPDGALSLWRQTSDGAATKFIYGPTAGWTPTALADGPDGLTRILWNKSDGSVSLWSQDSVSGSYTKNDIAAFPGYQAAAISVGPDNATHILWKRTSDDAISLWSLNPIDGVHTQFNYGPFPGWTAMGLSVGPDNKTRMLLRDANSNLRVWSQDSVTGAVIQYVYGPFAGWTPKSVAVDPSNQTHVLWSNTDGRTMLWSIKSASNVYTQFIYQNYPGWTASALGMGSDGQTRVLLSNPTGQAWLWSQNSATGAFTQFVYGPYAPWTATGIAN